MTDGGMPTCTPSSVKVFGSAILRVAPDTASITIAVSRLEQKPKDAFVKARQGAEAVNACLQKAGVKEFGASRVSLAQEFKYTNNENRFAGYRARIGYSILLRDLDRVDAVLTELIDAGANELTSVTFQTTRLKDIRADARRRAVAAAKEKAELYCAAAGVAVGPVNAIEDVNPETLAGRNEGHVYREPVAVDDAGELKAVDPGAITVGAAVVIYYELSAEAGH